MRFKSILILIVLMGSTMGQAPPAEGRMNPQNMDAIRIWKLTEVLELNEDQVLNFLPLVQIHERELRKIRKEMTAISKEIFAVVEADEVSQKQADEYIQKYTEKQVESNRVKSDFVKSLPKYLTPEQQLLYLSFESRFRGELREYMKNERRGDRKNINRNSKR